MRSERFESKFEDITEALTYLVITVIVPIAPIISSIIVNKYEWYLLVTTIAAAVALFYDTVRESRSMKQYDQSSKWVICENAIIMLSLIISIIASTIGIGAASGGEADIRLFVFISAIAYGVTALIVLAETIRIFIRELKNSNKGNKLTGNANFNNQSRIAQAAKEI